jgi:hypothetical protein
MGGILASKLQGSVSMKPLLFIGGETLTGDPIPGGGLFTGTEAEEFFSVDSTDAAALYLQVRIILPSGERTDRRRVLFDRVPPGIRAKGGSIDKADLLELPLLNDMPAMFSDVHQILVSTGGLNRHQVMIDLDQALSMASGILASDKPLNAGGLKEALLPVAASNFAWLAGVEQYQATIASQAGEGRWFIDRPRVYLRSVTQRPSPEGLMIGQVIDLLHDDVGVVARAGATADSKAAHRLSYGAMMSAVETVSGEVIAALTPMGGGTALSASMLTSAEPVRLSPGRVGDEDWMSSALANDLDKGLIVLSTDNIEEHHSWWTVDPATGATRSRGYEGISYTLLPRWVRLRLTSFSNKIYRVNAAELNRWAIETSKKAKIVKPKNPTNYRGIFKPRTGSSAADEYLTTVDVGLVLATTVGEGVALAIAFQLLLIMGMITYGVVTGVY